MVVGYKVRVMLKLVLAAMCGLVFPCARCLSTSSSLALRNSRTSWTLFALCDLLGEPEEVLQLSGRFVSKTVRLTSRGPRHRGILGLPDVLTGTRRAVTLTFTGSDFFLAIRRVLLLFLVRVVGWTLLLVLFRRGRFILPLSGCA
jgi:hypothetical protein